tara:strand:- start:7155 stop:7637 length:483 start_codon:yes stop_codon:yes gene_type:complete
MSHSLNNPNKEHFMNRTGSYSTHGSRRGFVDDGVAVESNDENRQALVYRIEVINKVITDFKRKYGIKQEQRVLQLPEMGKTRRQIPKQEFDDVGNLIKLKWELEQEIKNIPKPKVKRKDTTNLNVLMLEIYKKEFGKDIYKTIYLEALKRKAILTENVDQ